MSALVHRTVRRTVRRTAISLLCAALGALGVLAGRSDAAPPAGFSQPHQVRDLTSCIGQSATAADGTDVVYSEGGVQNDYTLNALVRLPGTVAWHPVPALHVHAYSLWGERLVAIGKSDVLLAVSWYDASGRPRFQLFRLATRTGRWSAPINAFPKRAHGDYEAPQVGVTATGGIVAATTYSSYDGSYHYGIEVAYRAPGSTTWRRQSYSQSGSWLFIHHLAVSSNGFAAVSFIQENATSPNAQTGAGVISRSPGSTAWRFQTLDVSGHVSRDAVAVGANGEALYVHSEDTGHTVHLARTVLPHGDSLPPWSLQDLTSSTAYANDGVFAAVDGRGHGTVLIDDLTPPLYVHLDHGAPTGPSPLDNGARRDIYGFGVRPDGVVVAATGEFSGGTPVYTGSDELTFPANGSFAVHPLESAGQPWTDGQDTFALGFDAANRAFVTFTTGSPTPDKCQYVDQPAKPDVMTSPSSGKYVAHTHTQRLAHDRLRCVSGFWVEARSLSYRWYRSGRRIPGQTGPVHKLVAADKGRRLTCRVLATNASGTRTLGP